MHSACKIICEYLDLQLKYNLSLATDVILDELLHPQPTHPDNNTQCSLATRKQPISRSFDVDTIYIARSWCFCSWLGRVDWDGDTSTYYTKTRRTIQSPDRLYKAPKRLYKAPTDYAKHQKDCTKINILDKTFKILANIYIYICIYVYEILNSSFEY